LLPSIPNEVLKRIAGFSVSQICDSLGSSQVETSIRPIDEKFKMCGRAVTVICVPDDNLAVLHALETSREGDVLVISTSGGDTAVWGEILSVAAQVRGVAGTVVDGAVRDVVEIRAMGYPVFARSINARRAQKERPGTRNVPLQCGSILVHPGDILLGDANGILAVPAPRVEGLIPRVEEISVKESQIKDQLLRGRSLADILRLRPLSGG
jgi:4-hydroxy-4-methyl-2-oxoglutarate aldolase